MPRDGAKRLVNEHFEKVHLTTIPHAGHQIVFDNSPDLCYHIIASSLHKWSVLIPIYHILNLWDINNK